MSKPFLKIAALLVFPVMILYALVLVPSFEIIASDIMLMNTLLLDAVDLLMQWAEIFALILIMAFLLVGTLHTESLLDCKPLFYLLGGALLLMTAVYFVGAMQPRDSAGIFPVGAADFVFYAASLTVIALLSTLKISDIRHRNLR